MPVLPCQCGQPRGQRQQAGRQADGVEKNYGLHGKGKGSMVSGRAWEAKAILCGPGEPAKETDA